MVDEKYCLLGVGIKEFSQCPAANPFIFDLLPNVALLILGLFGEKDDCGIAGQEGDEGAVGIGAAAHV